MKPSCLFVALGLALALPLALPGETAIAQPAKAPSAKAPLTADQIADCVQAFYNKTKTFQSGFKQKYTVKAYSKTKNSEGKVVFEKPGKMSWRYTNNNNRIVSDGKTVKIYEAENKQMYEQPMEKSQYPAALSFLVGEGDLKKTFILKKRDTPHFEGGYVLEGTPRDPTPAYQMILLFVDAATCQVRRAMLIDAQGNRNTFDFTSPSVNKKPPPDEFKFTPPPGTQVIKP